jgi:hypothetical protein
MGSPRTIKIRGRAKSGAFVADQIYAKLTFPKASGGRPKLLLRPDKSTVGESLVNGFTGTFEAERPKSMNGTGIERIVCEKVFFLSSITTSHGPDMHETRVKCDPVGVLHTIAKDLSIVATESKIVFWLTPNENLGPVRINSVRWDGTCEVRRLHTVTAPLSDAAHIAFDMNYIWEDVGEQRMVRQGFLVAECPVKFDAHDPAVLNGELTPLFDDFLAFASLASSRRVMCLGWQVSSEGRVTKYYRGNLYNALLETSHALDQGLIPPQYFQEFIDSIWPKFVNSPYRSAIKAVAFAAAPGHRRTIEIGFTSLFSAMEELLLTYRREKSIEFTLEAKRWEDLEKELKATIKNSKPEISSKARGLIYEHLRGGARVPIRHAFDEFVEEFNVDVTDLWPAFHGQSSLVAIRNRLVHGNFESDHYSESLAIAGQHLRWTVERLSLAVVQWPVAKSEVSPSFLASGAAAMARRDAAIRDLARTVV